MAITIKWDMTYKCNLNCEHCLNGDYLNGNYEEVPIEEIKPLFKELREKIGLQYVHLLGGEPTIKDDFFEITRIFDEIGINFGFNTNGLKLDKKEFFQLMHNKSLRNIVVSLEGPNSEVNDFIRGKKVFNVIVPKLKKLIEYKKENGLDYAKVTINCVVTKNNYMYVKDMIQLACDLGADEISFLGFSDSGNGKDKNYAVEFEEELQVINDIALIYPDVKDQIDISPKFSLCLAKDYSEKILLKAFPSVFHGCGAGYNFAFMDPSGNLFPCDRYLGNRVIEEHDRSDYNLIKNSINAIWGMDIFNEGFANCEGDVYSKKYEPCNECHHFKKNCYPCYLNGADKERVIIESCSKYMKLLSK